MLKNRRYIGFVELSSMNRAISEEEARIFRIGKDLVRAMVTQAVGINLQMEILMIQIQVEIQMEIH